MSKNSQASCEELVLASVSFDVLVLENRSGPILLYRRVSVLGLHWCPYRSTNTENQIPQIARSDNSRSHPNRLPPADYAHRACAEGSWTSFHPVYTPQSPQVCRLGTM